MTLRTLLALAVMIATPSVALAQHATTAQEGYKEANDKMMQDMMMPMSGDADKDFVMLMLRHHQGAVGMAQVELKYGKDPMLLDMAKKIVEAQEKEIAEMKKWQAENP